MGGSEKHPTSFPEFDSRGFASPVLRPCALCGQQRRLYRSHIIPEFCFADLYDVKHQFIEVHHVRQRGERKEAIHVNGAEAQPMFPRLTKQSKRGLNEKATRFNVWNACTRSFFGNYAANVCAWRSWQRSRSQWWACCQKCCGRPRDGRTRWFPCSRWTWSSVCAGRARQCALCRTRI